jgi:CBS domain-containing protein
MLESITDGGRGSDMRSGGGLLGGALRRSPLVVFPELSLGDLLRQVAGSRADAVVVVDPESRVPLGLLLLHDVLQAVVDSPDRTTPVANLMIAGISVLPVNAPILQAATLMVRQRLTQLVVVDAAGRLAGIVSLADLYTLDAGDTDRVVASISAASNLDHLSVAARGIRFLAEQQIALGVSPEVLCRWLSMLGDLVALRVIDLVEPKFDLPIVPWCWMLFGSAGRFEQTLVTDQDNGIVFALPQAPAAESADKAADTAADTAAETERLRAAFLPFAKAVNEALDRCGFPLCKGGIMASNPRWCLSLAEWKSKFFHWLHKPEPEALLNATIFFDFRGLYGDQGLVTALKAHMLEQATGSTLAMRLLAQQALDIEPPTRWWKDFVYSDKEHPHSIDLKKYGSRLFVDAARVLALTTGTAASSTVVRLRTAGERVQLSGEDLAALVDGFFVIQRLRLANQLRLAATDESQAEAANLVSPPELNEIERHLLRDAFAQARHLQRRLRMQLHLDGA